MHRHKSLMCMCLNFETLCMLVLVQGIPLRRFHWFVHIWVLHVLLLCPVRYVRFYANFILLRIHGLHLLCFLPPAWDHRFPCFLVVRPSYIPIDQVWIISQSLDLVRYVPSLLLYISFSTVKWLLFVKGGCDFTYGHGAAAGFSVESSFPEMGLSLLGF